MLFNNSRGKHISGYPGFFYLINVAVLAFSTNHDSSGTTEHTNRIVGTCNNPYYCKYVKVLPYS